MQKVEIYLAMNSALIKSNGCITGFRKNAVYFLGFRRPELKIASVPDHEGIAFIVASLSVTLQDPIGHRHQQIGQRENILQLVLVRPSHAQLRREIIFRGMKYRTRGM